MLLTIRKTGDLGGGGGGEEGLDGLSGMNITIHSEEKKIGGGGGGREGGSEIEIERVGVDWMVY